MIDRPYLLSAIFLLSTSTHGGIALAQDSAMIYPAQEQSVEQLADDRFECHLEGVTRSGFDPSGPLVSVPAGPITVQVPDNPKEGATATGAVVGAVAGMVVGSNNDHAIEGAVVGAVVGTVVGSAVESKGRTNVREQAQEQATSEAAARGAIRTGLERQRLLYHQTIQVCLEGRGYVVR